MQMNTAIRSVMQNAAIFQWQVAEELGIPETSFSRKLRHELPDSERERVLAAINRIVARREEGNN